jgi:hypothetical protein
MEDRMKRIRERRLLRLGRVSRLTRAIFPGLQEELGNPDFYWPV